MHRRDRRSTRTSPQKEFRCEAENHADIRKMIDYWKEVEFEIHPALDLAAMFRAQGMNIA